MELIIIIAIISYVVKAIKKANEEQAKFEQQKKTTYTMPKQATRVNSAKVQMQQQTNQWQQAARENIAKAKQRAQERAGEMYEQMNMSDYAPKQEKTQQQNKPSAMQQVHAGRIEARNTTILQRAKGNTDEDKVDVTLETMEAEHNHSERVAPAVHHHPEDVMSENMLGSVEDLIVKGYDGNLCFERDFVGEAMDMIGRFSLPSDVPDFSKDDVA